MHWLSLLALSLLTSASPLTSDFTTRHVLHNVPTGWVAVDPAPADHLIEMRIGLKQGRMDELISALEQVSDPSHARYGMHLSKVEVEELVAPPEDTVKTVEEWLNAHGVKVTGRSSAGDWLHARVPVARAERMLNTRYSVYRHTSGDHIIRSRSYALPRWMDGHIDLIQPTTYFGPTRDLAPQFDVEKRTLQGAAATNVTDCDLYTTPACLRKLYKTEGYVPNATDKNSMGITGYLGKSVHSLVEEYASKADLQRFFDLNRPDAQNPTFTVELVNGGQNNETNPGVEGNMDVQYANVITYPTPNIFYSTKGLAPFINDSTTVTSSNEPYLEWVNYMLAKDKLPPTISTSYGETEQTVPRDYAIRVCNSFAQLGARGISLLFASGDNGVGAGSCMTNSGTPRKQFQPLFPATCPFVTSVGATYGMSPETALVISQGGFSNYFKQPSYQEKIALNYMKSLGSTYKGLYNKKGRAFPDVAAQGRNFRIVLNGKETPVTGTSASTPTFAGVIALLNDYRLSKGGKPLGFLNPWLYKNADMLNDITLGHSSGCGTQGFNATVGWDPVTGLGTPDFEKMKERV
ncbi:hypothetical protein FRC09_016123 [Ceratobasidium sp. 395]|nr:hypothetical protein FRC09_016123 [Ceratobasidium sp. 395]